MDTLPKEPTRLMLEAWSAAMREVGHNRPSEVWPELHYSDHEALMVRAYQAMLLVSPTHAGPMRLDTDDRVFFYEQDHYYLSNFSAFKVWFGGFRFDTSEQAYHFQRFDERGGASHRHAILFADSAHEAFKYAQSYKGAQRADWDAVKVDVMREILRAKVSQHDYIRRKLLSTGDRTLIENSWRDPYWGWGEDRNGLNMLGKLWMEVREEARLGMKRPPRPR